MNESCGFCHGRPVGNAATWLDGKPRPPAACPRCGKTTSVEDEALKYADWYATHSPDAHIATLAARLRVVLKERDELAAASEAAMDAIERALFDGEPQGRDRTDFLDRIQSLRGGL